MSLSCSIRFCPIPFLFLKFNFFRWRKKGCHIQNAMEMLLYYDALQSFFSFKREHIIGRTVKNAAKKGMLGNRQSIFCYVSDKKSLNISWLMLQYSKMLIDIHLPFSKCWFLYIFYFQNVDARTIIVTVDIFILFVDRRIL